MATTKQKPQKGNVTTKILANGTEIETRKMDWGVLELRQEPDGTIRETKYDKLGHVLREQIIKPDGSEVEFVHQKDKIIETRLNADGSMDQIVRDPKTHEGYSFEYTSKDSEVPNTIRKDEFGALDKSMIEIYERNNIPFRQEEMKINKHTVIYPDNRKTEVIEKNGFTTYREETDKALTSTLKNKEGIVILKTETNRADFSQFTERYDTKGALKEQEFYKAGKSTKKMFGAAKELLCTLTHDFEKGISVIYNKEGKLQSITIKGKDGKEKTRTGLRAKLTAFMTGTARRLPKDNSR